MKRLLCIISLVCVLLSNVVTVYALVPSYSKTDDLKKDIEQAKAEYETAKRKYDELLTQYNEKKASISLLEAQLEEYKQELTTVESDKSAKYNAWQSALGNLNSKKNDCQAKLDAYDVAQANYKKGSIGFFEAMGSTDAINVIRNCKYASYTHEGDTKDATNLENMLESIRFIKQGNSCRFLEGVDPANNNVLHDLKISDYMMATAQANANYSVGIINHSSQFNVAENLAWGYIDPYKAWYTDEKALYQSGTREFMQVGHYLNLVNSSYSVTGFAKTIGGPYGYVYSQTFLWSSGAGQSYTYDDYLNRFMTYYNKIVSDINNLKPEIDSINATISSLELEAKRAENDYSIANGRILELNQLIPATQAGIDNQNLELHDMESNLKILYDRMISFKDIYDEYVQRYNEISDTEEYESLETSKLPEEIETEISEEKTTEESSEDYMDKSTIDKKSNDMPTQSAIKETSKKDESSDDTDIITIGATKESSKDSESKKANNIFIPIAIGVAATGCIGGGVFLAFKKGIIHRKIK